MEKEFKNYKEKQAYYRELAKQEKMFWVSSPPQSIKDNAKRVKKDMIIKGNTYVKPKESLDEKD